VESLFVSDLHLARDRPTSLALFRRFLAERAPRAEALYLLGDLFDVWIGDDDDAPPAPEVIAALRALAETGTRLYFMRGNRDFLIGRRFAWATSCRILTDPTVVRLYGEPTLLMHGDLLCSDDIAYQRFRRRVRNPVVRQLFLWKPLARRRAIAEDYRQRSGQAMAEKPEAIMDVNPDRVCRLMIERGVRRLIHGHTHRPADHRFQLNGQPAERIVLAEWRGDYGEVLSVSPEGVRRESLREADRGAFVRRRSAPST
jgi:UDP-2,3-diacylglucosamine hydrolase